MSPNPISEAIFKATTEGRMMNVTQQPGSVSFAPLRFEVASEAVASGTISTMFKLGSPLKRSVREQFQQLLAVMAELKLAAVLSHQAAAGVLVVFGLVHGKELKFGFAFDFGIGAGD